MLWEVHLFCSFNGCYFGTGKTWWILRWADASMYYYYSGFQMIQEERSCGSSSFLDCRQLKEFRPVFNEMGAASFLQEVTPEWLRLGKRSDEPSTEDWNASWLPRRTLLPSTIPPIRRFHPFPTRKPTSPSPQLRGRRCHTHGLDLVSSGSMTNAPQ